MAMLMAYVLLKVNLKMENFKDKGNTLTNKMLNWKAILQKVSCKVKAKELIKKLWKKLIMNGF